MLLRRVIDHVKAQNWTAVVLDFVIVVVGVFIGIQVSEWDSKRADAKRGVSLQTRLMEDLKAEHEAYGFYLDYYHTVSDYAEEALDLFDRRDGEYAERFLISAYNATQYIEARPIRSAYDEMVVSGTFRYIDNDDFRESVMSHYHSDDRHRLSSYALNSTYRKTLRQTMLQPAQQAVRSNCGDIRTDKGFVMGLQTDCSLDLNIDEIRLAVGTIRDNNQLASELRFFTSTLDAYIDDVESQRHNLGKLIAMNQSDVNDTSPRH